MKEPWGGQNRTQPRRRRRFECARIRCFARDSDSAVSRSDCLLFTHTHLQVVVAEAQALQAAGQALQVLDRGDFIVVERQILRSRVDIEE